MTEPDLSRPPGTVYTFYSFKGGVGRSMALANVAVLLARWGKRVLAIDFDLEAPGLEKYFADGIPRERSRLQVPGLVDLVTELGAGRAADWRDHLICVTVPGSTSIDLMTAGRADASYVSRLAAINWHKLFEESDFGDVFEALRNEWVAEYDFVLIDSRTGFTDIGGICTIHLPDVLVALFSANHQNLEGVRDVIRQARRSHSALPYERSPLLVLPVPARDETDNEYLLGREWRTRFAAELKGLFDDWAPETLAVTKLLDFVRLPYFPYWSFGERLPVLDEEASNPKTLAGSFAFLARLVLHRLDWDQAVSGSGAAAAELAAIHAQIREARQLATEAQPSPYPGPRPFSTADAATLFGRDAEAHDIVRRIDAGEREIYVVGPSGCGKSSLVLAGVLPRLERGAGGERPFAIATMRPGDNPAQRLAEALEIEPAESTAGRAAALAGVEDASVPAGGSLLLIIDQLEEVFSLASPAARAEFASALAALRADPRCVFLGVLRADYLAAFLDSQLWVDGDRRSARIEIGSPPREALRDIVVEPARVRGVDVDPKVVERVLGEVGLEPGNLALLQIALRQLWQIRRGSRITLADYEVLGGGDRGLIAAVISSQADAALRALSSDQQAIARRTLLRLVSFGEGRASTRRLQPVAALRAAADAAGELDRVLEHLVASRLLVMTSEQLEPCVALAHESLIDAWPTLADRMTTLRASEERRRHLENEARDWVRRERSADDLLGAGALAEIEAWLRTESSDLGASADLREFLTASQTVREQARRRRSRVRRGVLALSVTWVLLAAGVVLSTSQWRGAVDESERVLARTTPLLRGTYQEIGRQLLLDGRAPEALPYLVAARQQGEDGWPLRLLFGTALGSLPIVPPLEHAGFVYRAAFSPDGTRVVTASVEQTAYLWDAVTERQIAALRHAEAVYGAAFSSDGKRVVTASADHTARIWDSATGGAVGGPLVHPGIVHGAAFSPDGKRVVTVSDDPVARVWDVPADQPVDKPIDKPVGILSHDGPVNAAMFSPDGTRVVTASDDGTARLWIAGTSAPPLLLRHDGPVIAAAFSPDGTRVVTASRDRTARVWDAATGKPLTSPIMHRDTVSSAVFSPDGACVATASADHTARIWDAVTGKPLTEPLEHRDMVTSVAFSPDGTRVITASADSTARIWSAVTGDELSRPLQHPGPVSAAAFSPDGTQVVTASADHTRIWDATPGLPRWSSFARAEASDTAAFNPDGSHVVIASANGTVRIHDLATGKLLVEVHHGTARVSAAFSSDGTRVATTGNDQTVRIWNSATGAPVATIPCNCTANDVEFSPDGTRIAVANDDGTARVLDAATRAQLAVLSGHRGAVRSIAFTPDGRRVATAGDDGTVRIWDPASAKPPMTLLGHAGAVNAVRFSSRDGARLVTASDDRTARVWDTGSGSQLLVLADHHGAVSSAAFSPDGTCILTASADRTVRMWNAATGKPLSLPLELERAVASAAFSVDGEHLVTAAADVRIWTLRVDRRTLLDWSKVAAERSAFRLEDGVLVQRTPGAGKSPESREVDPPATVKDP